jgi:hypothetical protein
MLGLALSGSCACAEEASVESHDSATATEKSTTKLSVKCEDFATAQSVLVMAMNLLTVLLAAVNQ